MSKRHHSNRRKTYGRRQHELHERRQRDAVRPDELDTADDAGPTAIADRLSFFDPRLPRLRYALGD